MKERDGGISFADQSLYLDLLKKCLTRSFWGETYQNLHLAPSSIRKALFSPILQLLARFGFKLVRRITVNPALREEGRDWPAEAETMIGLRRLDNLQACITDVLRQGVAGDLIETGVWRGGATIFMRAVLKAFGDTTRCVWVADSFQGLPRPNPSKYPQDLGDLHWSFTPLAIPLEEVKNNFARYNLLDDQVCFLPGWFRDTLPSAPITKLAVLRLDGDMYESTVQALESLYPKLSIGGYVIVDDYGAIPKCRQAVQDYREREGIRDEIIPVDWTGVYWKKSQ